MTTSGTDNSDNLTELTADDIDSLLNNYDVTDQATSGSTESHIPSTSDDELTTEALKYVAGYVSFKVRRDYPELGTPTGQTNSEPNRIQTLSRGGLRQPFFGLVSNCAKFRNGISCIPWNGSPQRARSY